MMTPDHWLRRAAEARAGSKTMTDMRARLTLLRIAEEYDWLATHAALRTGQLAESQNRSTSDPHAA
jgi:hypothetical protein